METVHRITLDLTRRKVLVLLTLFFLCWRPGSLGSETLTMTTYYPAPYGGYARLLTTDQTILARDGGGVAIRKAAPDPASALDVNGAIYWGGSQLNTDQGGSIELGQIGGGMPYIDFHWGGGGDFNTRLVNDADGRLTLLGDLNMGNANARITGTNMSISGLCTSVPINNDPANPWTNCPIGASVVNVGYDAWTEAWACIGRGSTPGLEGLCIAGTNWVGTTGSLKCCRIE